MAHWLRLDRLLYWSAALCLASSCALLRAKEVQIIPAWTVQVLDETGKPVAGFQVDQTWEFYGLSGHSGSATRLTDANGRVFFPTQLFTVSGATYIAARAMTMLNVHASFGPSGRVGIFSKVYKRSYSRYAPDGKVYDHDGGKTTQDKDGFLTVIQFQRLDFFDFLFDRDWVTMRQILAGDPATVGLRDSLGATPLIVLSAGDHTGPNGEMIDLLLAAGADVNAQAKDGTTALHNAAKDSNVAYMELLLSKGADPKVKIHDSIYSTTNGFTSLHFLLSASGDSMKMISPAQKIAGIDLLQLHGVDINAKDNAGATPLHLAAVWGDPELVAALLTRGADAQAKNKAGQTALDSIRQLDDTPPVHRIRELLNQVPRK